MEVAASIQWENVKIVTEKVCPIGAFSVNPDWHQEARKGFSISSLLWLSELRPIMRMCSRHLPFCSVQVRICLDDGWVRAPGARDVCSYVPEARSLNTVVLSAVHQHSWPETESVTKCPKAFISKTGAKLNSVEALVINTGGMTEASSPWLEFPPGALLCRWLACPWETVPWV